VLSGLAKDAGKAMTKCVMPIVHGSDNERMLMICADGASDATRADDSGHADDENDI
jgi:hypothetical protein